VAKIFTQKELQRKFENISWVFPYEEILAAYDERSGLIMMVEDYMQGVYAEAWRVYHFPRTSRLVEYARREGTKSIFYLREGEAQVNLVPSFAPIGINKVKVKKNNIQITYSGIGGGGVSAAYCRGLAKGVLTVKVLKEAGGNRQGEATIILPKFHHLIIGVDDTDNEKEGATYALVHNIASRINNGESIRYISHVNTQLYPENPTKTKNCMSTSVGILVRPGLEDKVIKFFIKELKKETFSSNTSMVVMRGFFIPKKLRQYSRRLRTRFFKNLSYTKNLIKELGLEYHLITGEKGLIGALGALAMHNSPDLAATLPPGFGKMNAEYDSGKNKEWK
jgi:methanogenesis imperfect marker protein 11